MRALYLIQAALALCLLFVYQYTHQFQPQSRVYKNINDASLTTRLDGRTLVTFELAEPGRRMTAHRLVSEDFVTLEIEEAMVHTPTVTLTAKTAQRTQDRVELRGSVQGTGPAWRIQTADVTLEKNTLRSRSPTHYSAPNVEIDAAGFDYDTIADKLQLRAPSALLTNPDVLSKP